MEELNKGDFRGGGCSYYLGGAGEDFGGKVRLPANITTMHCNIIVLAVVSKKN